jgi:hypothetical protein
MLQECIRQRKELDGIVSVSQLKELPVRLLPICPSTTLHNYAYFPVFFSADGADSQSGAKETRGSGHLFTPVFLSLH